MDHRFTGGNCSHCYNRTRLTSIAHHWNAQARPSKLATHAYKVTPRLSTTSYLHVEIATLTLPNPDLQPKGPTEYHVTMQDYLSSALTDPHTDASEL